MCRPNVHDGGAMLCRRKCKNIENRVVGGHGGIVVVEEAWMYRV